MPQAIISVDSATRESDLASLERLARAIAEAREPADLVELANRAEAYRRYAERARLGLVLQNRFAEIRLKAERHLGAMLSTMIRLRGRPQKGATSEHLPRLSDLGVTRKLSSRSQKLARIPARLFETFIRDAQRAENEISTRALLNLVDRKMAAQRNRRKIIGGIVDDLFEFARSGPKMGCVYLDPPWRIPGASVLAYQTMPPEELARLPILELAAPRCHLHIWAGNGFLFDAEGVIRAWGFRPVSTFVWVTHPPGRGNYWREAHSIMLTAVRGRDDRFDDHSLRSWIELPRGRHSEKPDAVRDLVVKASPGPRLELFARKTSPGWYAWGHEISSRLHEQGAGQ
jgi:N6-adenosine-specific RNA methylase IME4